MQRNPQTPQGQRPAARPQQAYNPNQRPPVRPQQAPSGTRPAPKPQQAAPLGARPAARPQPTAPSGAKPAVRPQQGVPAANRPAQRSPQQRPQAASSRPAQPPRKPAAAPQKRPAAPAFRGRRDNRPLIISAIAIAVILGLGCLLQYVVYPGGYFPSETTKAVAAVAEIASSRGVRINEVMTSNKTTVSDSDGNYPDWIELTNVSNDTVDITGWALLDKASRSTYFTFPEYQLAPGEMVLVFASGHLANENGADFHAPFRLSSSGDTLMLSDAHSTVVESINIPALGSDQSYARMDGGWQITSEYTPGLGNTLINYAALTSTQPVSGSTLLITEIMADNVSYKATDGGLYDWIEIQNFGSSPVNLRGYGLSDTPAKPAQWKFPEVTLQPGQCMVVYASGLDQTAADGALHTNFGLRAEGESVLLYNQSGQVLDYIEYDNLKPDQSLQRQSDGSYTTSDAPTPGQAN